MHTRYQNALMETAYSNVNFHMGLGNPVLLLYHNATENQNKMDRIVNMNQNIEIIAKTSLEFLQQISDILIQSKTLLLCVWEVVLISQW
jgi:hypothetical protein